MTPKPADAQQVTAYMTALIHPLKQEINAVRDILKAAHPSVHERIKWNAPSYFTTVDLVTFNHRNQSAVHLVFHHAAIVSVVSPHLEGTYADRRMMYFRNMGEVLSLKGELTRIMKEYVAGVAAMEGK